MTPRTYDNFMQGKAASIDGRRKSEEEGTSEAQQTMGMLQVANLSRI